MKTILTLLLILAPAGIGLAADQLPVGSISSNQTFAVNDGQKLVNTSLQQYDGSILIVMLYTPWCPICQSHARSAGLGLAGHYADPGRGELIGKNANGVPVRTLLISTEEAAQWDSTNKSFAETNGYLRWGIDANASRNSPRVMLGYFRGGFIPGSNLYDWGNDRRRLVVLNLVEKSSSHQYREILINQNSYSSSDNTAARKAVDAVQAAAVIDPPEDPEIDNTAPAVGVTSRIPVNPVMRKLTLVGRAMDSGGVARVYATVNSRKARLDATGTTRWRIELSLPKGTHTVRVHAVDNAGNTSRTGPFKVRSTGKLKTAGGK